MFNQWYCPGCGEEECVSNCHCRKCLKKPDDCNCPHAYEWPVLTGEFLLKPLSEDSDFTEKLHKQTEDILEQMFKELNDTPMAKR